MIPEKETLTVEFKSDKKKLKDSILIDAAVGMSNTEGGNIYLGVEDDGTVTGIHPDHRDPVGLASLIANNTVPSITAQTSILKEEQLEIMEIAVPASSVLIATSDGKVLKRRLKLDGSPETTPLYPNEMTSRLSSLGVFDYSAQILSGSSRDDFDPVQYERLRRLISQFNGDTILLELTDLQIEQALGLVRQVNGNWIPTVAGMLMLGKKNRIRELIPTARVAFQVLQNSRVVVNEDLTAPLPELFEMCEKMFVPWNPETEFMLGMQRIGIPEFDLQAFREAVINAFCHRDYSLLGSVRILIDEDGLTINSPGGFLEGVTIKNLLTVPPRGRNPLLADILKRLGLTERTGRGIDKIFVGSWKYGKPEPDYSESVSNMVTLFVPRGKPDFPFVSMLAQNRMENPAPSPLGYMILNRLLKNKYSKLPELLNSTGISSSRIERQLNVLEDMNLIESTSQGYKLNIHELENKKPPVELEDLQAQALQLFNSRTSLQRNQIQKAMGLSTSQTSRLLKTLVKSQQLILEKKGNRSHYHLP